MREFLIFLLIILPCIGFSQHNDFKPLTNPTELKAGIEKVANSTNSIKTAFNQKKYISILSNAIESEGIMVFKKPEALKWAYTSPYNYVIIFNDDEIVINDEGKVSAFDISSSKAFLEINQIIVNSVSGNILQEDQFNITYFENEAFYLAKLSPKATHLKEFIELIEVYLDKKDFTVSRIKLIEKGNDYTLINFFDKKLNVNISDDTFNVK